MTDKSQIVLAEHIDVMLLGHDADKLVKLLYQTDSVVSNDSNPSHSGYLNHIKALLKTTLDLRTKHISKPQILHLGNMSILTRSLLTRGLWLSINFHYPNHQFYDVFVSDFLKGSCNIAIIVQPSTSNETRGSYADIKRLMHGAPESHLRYDNKQITGNSKNEPFYESRVMARMHRPQLAQFQHIISVQVDDGDLINTETGAHMTINQLLRWMAEKHFESTHHVKLTKAMGDEIEFSVKEEPQVCRLF